VPAKSSARLGALLDVGLLEQEGNYVLMARIHQRWAELESSSTVSLADTRQTAEDIEGLPAPFATLYDPLGPEQAACIIAIAVIAVAAFAVHNRLRAKINYLNNKSNNSEDASQKDGEKGVQEK
jgi:hypothetical protein